MWVEIRLEIEGSKEGYGFYTLPDEKNEGSEDREWGTNDVLFFRSYLKSTPYQTTMLKCGVPLFTMVDSS